MNSRPRTRISHLTMLVAFASCLQVQAAVAAYPAAKNVIEVKMVFPGLNQNLFDRKYGNATLSALAMSAGVPKESITWVSRMQTTAARAAVPVSKPAAAEPAAAEPAAAAAAPAAKVSTTPAAAAASTANEAAAKPAAAKPAAAKPAAAKPAAAATSSPAPAAAAAPTASTPAAAAATSSHMAAAAAAAPTGREAAAAAAKPAAAAISSPMPAAAGESTAIEASTASTASTPAAAKPTAATPVAAKPAAAAATSSSPTAAAAPTANEAPAAPAVSAAAAVPATAAASNGSKQSDTDTQAKRDAQAPAAAAAPTAAANAAATNISTATPANASTAGTTATAPVTDKLSAAASPTPRPSEVSGNATPVSSSNVTSLSSGSSSSSSDKTKGARRLLAPAAAATAIAVAPVQPGATAIYRIGTSSLAATTSKLQAALTPPGYTFLANLEQRGVPYKPTVYMDGAMILEGRPAFSGSPRQAPAAVASSGASMRGKPADEMYGPLPQRIFIAIVVLAGLVAVLLIGTCVGISLAVRASARYRRRQEEERERGQFIKSGDSSDSRSSNLTPAPGGGVVPTQGALAQLNASFPKTTDGKSPRSVASNVNSVHTVYTIATTARSNVGLMAAPDGKAPDGKKVQSHTHVKSKILESDDVEFHRQCLRDGKPVPILPHSRIVKPLTSSIKVPMTPSRANGNAANAQLAGNEKQQQ